MKRVKLKEIIKEVISDILSEAKIKNNQLFPMPKWGGYYAVIDGVLYYAPMNSNNSVDLDGFEIDLMEVTAPRNQKFLDDINKNFGTNYNMDEFTGR